MHRLLQLAQLALAFIVLTAIVWSGSWLIDDGWDRYWLLLINPDDPLTIVDGLMLLVTKISMSLAGIMVVLWLAGYGALQIRFIPLALVEWTFRLLALAMLIALATSPHWYKPRELEWVFYLGAVMVPLGVEVIVQSLKGHHDEMQERILKVLLLLVVSVLLTYLVRNAIAHGLAPRPRPLNPVNQDWNGALRAIHDERVRGGSSYVSGHVSTVFAMASMLVYCIRVRAIQAGLVAWALLMALSRVYLAAHYPFCVFMAALLGVGSTWATILIFAPRAQKESIIIGSFRPSERSA
jgi:membrane-associated phospholipid phosphatase